MKDKVREILENAGGKYVILDGGMGTMIQAAGLEEGEHPETLVIREPEAICGIQRKYVEAGSSILYSCTFRANRKRVEGSGYSVEEIISGAVKVARQAAEGADHKVYVALDIGPIGELLEPYGTLSFEEAVDIFAEMVRAGVNAGADLIIMETMTDLYEVKAAVLAARENSDLPLFVTMSYEKSGRTFTGTTVESMVCVLEGLGVDAIGINCSLGPDDILPVAERLNAATKLPMLIKANAGLPDPETGEYGLNADSFVELMKPYKKLEHMTFTGGCCGTAPDFIEKLSKELNSGAGEGDGAAGHLAAAAGEDEISGGAAGSAKDRVSADSVESLAGVNPAVFSMGVSAPESTVICTPTQVVTIDSVKVIGERINPTGKKRFQQALRENDIDYILDQAIQQVEAGADILDVNVGLPGIDEPSMMVRVVKAIQSVVDVPLQIDSSDPVAVEAGLRVCNGKPIVNSVNGKDEVLHSILPIVKKYGASVLGLCIDEEGIPQTAEKRISIAKKILNTALSYGIPKEDLFIDCLSLTISAQQDQALETLKAIRYVHDVMGLHTVLGVSNISFGLPYRELVNSTFLTMAMANGLDLPIINPNNEAMMNAVRSFRALTCVDRDCLGYIDKYADYKPQAAAAPTVVPGSGNGSPAGSGDTGVPVAPGCDPAVLRAISKGLKADAVSAVNALLDSKDELSIINDDLIPALDEVGKNFEAGKIFLPQLLNAAGAAGEAFEVIKKRIAASGSGAVSKGKIILATVKGDIHDIGKNIVKVILENYGYTVIDLGKDVDPQLIVDTAIREDVKLVGLSALMTTTLVGMEETIRALRDSGHDCRIICGGAVLTKEYALKIGADYYAKDASESASIAKEVFGA